MGIRDGGGGVVLAVGGEQPRLDDLLGMAPAEALLPAVAVAWSLGFTPEQIRTVLMTAARQIPASILRYARLNEPAI